MPEHTYAIDRTDNHRLDGSGNEQGSPIEPVVISYLFVTCCVENKAAQKNETKDERVAKATQETLLGLNGPSPALETRRSRALFLFPSRHSAPAHEQ